jgi:hypothetical protein
MPHNNLRRARPATLPTSAQTTLVVIVRHLAHGARFLPAAKKICVADHLR